VPEGDASEATKLLLERLQAYKHMTGYLEDYIKEVAKDEKSSAKEKEKILNSVSSPLKEGHHFDQSLGGVAGLFENIRANTLAQSNMHLETSKNLTGTVLPILERLHAEIKNKGKELNSGAGKSSKAVDKARNTSQKHIEALGQHSAMFDSAGGKTTANNDPYVLRRGIHHRLNKQILEENNSRQDTLAVQNSFQQFEAHVLTTVQAALNSYQQFMGGQCDSQKAMYGDITGTAQKMPLDFEWNGFVRRNEGVLVSPNAAPRTMSNISFPNQNHRATKALIEGSLERRGKGIGAITGYSSGYYALTPAGYLHEFKDDDDYREDPVPKTSLYLPDCTIGAVDGVKFAIKGKDTSGSKIGSKMSITGEYNFKAHTAGDAQQWHSIIMGMTGGSTGSAPISPVATRDVSGQYASEKQPIPINTQQQGVVGGPQSAGSRSAGPQSAGGAGSHFHGATGGQSLEDRKYVQ
jgi:hypothetical protein